MRGRSTLILLVLAAGFGAYLYFVDAKKPEADANAKPKVFNYETAKVDQIEVKSAAGEVTALKKEPGGWVITRPNPGPADQTNASEIAASVATLDQDRIVDENPTDLKTYGLDPPRLEVTFNVSGDKDPKRLLVGDKAPTGMGMYAKLPNDKRVLLVTNQLDVSLNRSTFDLRDKTALKFDATKIDTVELTAKGQTIRLTKSGDEWKIVKPIETAADLTAVEGLIGQLQAAQMTSLKDKPEDVKDLKTYGLDKPDATVAVSGGGSNVVFQIGGNADPTRIWARDAARTAVFTVTSSIGDALKKTVNDFRRKEVFDFRPFNATRFEIARGKDVKVFERVKGSGANATDTWKQTTPAVKTVDAGSLEGALMDFSDLRADAFVDAAPAAANNPSATITVTFDEGKRHETVKFGGSPTDMFAVRSDRPGAMKLELGKLDEALKKLDALK